MRRAPGDNEAWRHLRGSFHQDWGLLAEADPRRAFAQTARGIPDPQRIAIAALLDRSLRTMTDAELSGLWRRSGAEVAPNRHGIRPLLEKHVCDVIMPDITRCGGPSEMKRMATMAEAYQVLVAPHNPNGPLSTLASAHVCATLPNFFRQEFMFTDVPWRDTVITAPLDVRDGHLVLSDRPGLGVDLVEEVMEQHPGVRTAREGFYV